jgi:hypothetical protein
MSYHRNFPITIIDPDTGEEVDAQAFFWFYPGYSGNWDTPPEPPFLDVIDICVGGVSILDKLSIEQYMNIYSELLAIMEEGFYGTLEL